LHQKTSFSQSSGFESSHDVAECTAIDSEFVELGEPHSYVLPRNCLSFRLVHGAIKQWRPHIEALYGGCNFVGRRLVGPFGLRWKRHALISRTAGYWKCHSELEFYWGPRRSTSSAIIKWAFKGNSLTANSGYWQRERSTRSPSMRADVREIMFFHRAS